MNGMFDVQLLGVLRELSERGTVTAVAAAMHRTPSAVSQQLQTLQRQVGVPIIERVGRGVRLTDAGQALAESAVGIATAIADAEASWERHLGGTTGKVTVAVFPSAAELLLPGLLKRMREHEQIELELHDRDVTEAEFPRLTADYDIVVGHRSEGVIPDARVTPTVVPLFREPLDVGVSVRHRLAGRSRVEVHEVIGEPWIGVPRDFPLDRALAAMAARTDAIPEVIYRTIQLTVIENFVAAGHGVALLPRYTSRTRAAGRFHLAEIADVRAGRHIEALLRPDVAPRLAVTVVLEALQAEAAAVAR